MSDLLPKRFTMSDLRLARETGTKVPVLTCYDYTTARLMHAAGVRAILVGDSAANVILGHDTTLPVSIDFMTDLTAGVRRGAPGALVMADMPFGSYGASDEQGATNAFRMVQLSGCDCVKMETTPGHASLVSRLADSGVAVMAHIGLRPQSVGLLGGYKAQGRTPADADAIVDLAVRMEKAGASALLVEAVPDEVGAAVVASTSIPVIGCGAGPACHGYVVVLQDLLGLTDPSPRFVPDYGDAVKKALTGVFARWVDEVKSELYPSADHAYGMTERKK